MDKEEFTYFYNKVKFQEKENDPFSSASVQRKCLALNFFGSISSGQDNDVTNFLLAKNLESYAKIVDDQSPGSVNNYSEDILALLPPNQYNNRKTWKSDLEHVKLEDYIKPLPCSNNKLGCSNVAVDEVLLNELRLAFQDTEETHSDRSHLPELKASTSKRYYEPDFPTDQVKCNKQEINFNLDFENPGTCAQTKPEETKFKFNSFRTAREELHLQNLKKNKINNSSSCNEGTFSTAPVKKCLGTRQGGVFNKFKPPTRPKDNPVEPAKEVESVDEEIDERLKNIDPKMVELIKNEIMDSSTTITWDDIAGLELAKNTIQEIVVWPMLRPDIFTGLRRPPKGILLFGPPGTGKTLIGKCIASQSCSTFFSISASSLTSKWIGDGEKMVRALFAVARCHQPAVVFIDEIDSLLSQRSDSEHESSRRLKTEFLVQLDGAGTAEEDRILIIGATNRPQELDEAARRRLVKRLYIPLPDEKARGQIIHNLISKERHRLTDEEIHEISVLCKGYSGADMKNLCQEASLGPIRSIPPSEIRNINANEVRPLNVSDFKSALNRIKSSVSEGDLDIYIKWDKQYGCGSGF